MDTLDRFAAKVVKSPEPDGCWLWTAGCFKNGYPAFWSGSAMVRANRFAYETFVAPLAPGEMALHTCDNVLCVRPEHLYGGTHDDNMRDRETRHRTASGDQNGMRTRPDRNASILRPERLARGERAHKSVLTEADVSEIRVQAAAGVTQVALARRFGISQPGIAKIVHRLTWTHVK